MKISEITVGDLVEFMRIDDPNEVEIAEIGRMRQSAISFMVGYTGLTAEELDLHEDLTHALFILVTDMFDNRNLQLDKAGYLNKSVECILRMHSVNLL